MNGELALSIALASYGNTFLASEHESKPPELFGTNSTLRYVSSIAFHADDTPLESPADAARRTEQSRVEALRWQNGTSSWFLSLRAGGASKLHVAKLPTQVDLPEVHAAGFSGGILWAILADLPGTPRLWVPRWKYEGGDKPWKVRVTGLASIHSPPQTVVGLTEAERSLRSALESALDFSTRAELEWFPGAFSKALALLDSETPEIPYHPDLLPSSGYSLLARKIAASSSMAYVFGGMGSFNDIWFGGHRLKTAYKVLLPTLYNAVTDGLLAAADSFGRQ